MSARDEFVQRLGVWEDAVLSEVLIAQSPLKERKNERARILRNGLAVVGFSILEDFIRTRIGEALGELTGNTIPFGDLPERLQRAATVDAVRAIGFQANLRAKSGEDAAAFVQQEAALLASTGTSSFRISPYSFAHSSSNLLHAELTGTLSAVNVNGGWAAMSAVAGRVDLGIPALTDVYKAAYRNRNLAAHDASADIGLPDLKDFPLEAKAIALSFDALLSLACARLASGDTRLAAGEDKVEAKDVSIRFVRESHDKSWREMAEGADRAYRRKDSFDDCWAGAYQRAQRHDQLLVAQVRNRVPLRWSCLYLE